MLVFFSDIHLADGTSGETINEGAFELFADQVADLAHKREARAFHLVLLGDGIDVIRSSRWLAADSPVRPWTPRGGQQESLVLDILRATVDRNRAALAHLRGLPERIASRGHIPADRVGFDYVLGNHDWLINRYRSTREVTARALGMPERYVDRGFPAEYISPPEAYDVVARHGDVYDRLNYDGRRGRDAASLGDVVTVEILNRFPLEVAAQLEGHPRRQAIVTRLREVDNVRPYSRIGAWVAEVIGDLENEDPQFVEAARRALVRCAEDALRSPVFNEFARRQLGRTGRAYLRVLLDQVRRRQFDVLDWMTRFGERLWAAWRILKGVSTSELLEYALGEQGPGGHMPRFVIYGHTHKVDVAPLPEADDRGQHRYYLNTGTWRPVWERSETAGHHTEFASWKEMTYVVLYSPSEAHHKHEFEMWTGSLLDRSPQRLAPG